MSLRDTPEPESDFRPATPAGSLGLWLFLAALSMLFLSSLLGYALIRQQLVCKIGWNILHLPTLLWLSTAFMLAASFALQSALTAIRHNQLRPFRISLIAATILALAFVAVQTPAIAQLLSSHSLGLSTRGIGIYGLIFFLILLHALHVLGGLVTLARILPRALAGAYTADNLAPLRHATLYWHFLDAVWLAMFSTLYLMR